MRLTDKYPCQNTGITTCLLKGVAADSDRICQVSISPDCICAPKFKPGKVSTSIEAAHIHSYRCITGNGLNLGSEAE